MIIFIFFSIGIINSQIIKDDKFSPISTETFQNNIGNYQYKSIKLINKDIIFYSETCDPCFLGVYPYVIDLPSIRRSSFNFPRFIVDSQGNKQKKEFIDEVQNSIQSRDFTNNTPFILEAGISYIENQCQAIIVWDSKRTFLILNEPNKTKDSLNITLGKGLNQFDSFRNMPPLYFQSQRLIFEISTSILIKIGCQDISQSISNETTLPLFLSSSRMHNLGGEKVYIQGPCYNKMDPFPKLIIESLNNPNLRIVDIAIYFDNLTNSFALISPIIWYTGLYQFQLSYKNFSFTSSVEIYSFDEISNPFEIIDINEMKNWYYKRDNIRISIPNIESCVKFSFYAVDLAMIDKNNIPISLVNNEIRIVKKSQENQILLVDLLSPKINISSHVGFLACSSASNELRWSNSFSLMCLHKYDPNKLLFNSQCQNYISETLTKKDYFCPENLLQAKGLYSTFRSTSINLRFQPDDFQKYVCFIQMTFSENENGVTCCYNKTTNALLYGQDYYLRNNSIAGSYKWKFSPLNNLLKHYLYDLIPITECCSSDNDTLCSESWDKRHAINIKSFEEDLKGNAFGDPHFLPFKSSSKYTYLAKGDFPLVITRNNILDLQARFYHETDKQNSLLKAIVFRIPSIRISITLSTNNRTNIPWKILASTNKIFSIDALPFYHENVLIFQNSIKTKLDIYIKIDENYRIYFEIERYFYSKGNLEYINLKAHFSNNMKDIISGGLFGKVDNQVGSTGLYPPNSEQPITETNDDKKMFDFCQKWKFNENDSLFFEKIDIPNVAFQEISSSTFDECDKIHMCEIDKTNFMNENIHLTTKINYEYRMTIEKEWNKSLLEKKFCGHPPIKKVRYSSENFHENSQISIVGCINLKKQMDSGNYTLICEKKSNSMYGWKEEPKIAGDLCIQDKNISAQNPTVLVYAAVGATILVLLVLVFVILFFLVQRRRRSTKIVKSNSHVESSTRSEIPLEDFYDVVIKPENEYCTYAEIQKDFKK